MKKIMLILGFVITAISNLSAQVVVDAEMFKANPNSFMGKVVTIKNVTLKEANCHQPNGPVGVVNLPSNSVGTGAPVGVAGPSSGKSQTMYCNPQPKMTLTKWSFGPNNTNCLQVDEKLKPILNGIEVGKVVKSVSFRVTPTMYLVTRIEP